MAGQMGDARGSLFHQIVLFYAIVLGPFPSLAGPLSLFEWIRKGGLDSPAEEVVTVLYSFTFVVVLIWMLWVERGSIDRFFPWFTRLVALFLFCPPALLLITEIMGMSQMGFVGIAFALMALFLVASLVWAFRLWLPSRRWLAEVRPILLSPLDGS